MAGVIEIMLRHWPILAAGGLYLYQSYVFAAAGNMKMCGAFIAYAVANGFFSMVE